MRFIILAVWIALQLAVQRLQAQTLEQRNIIFILIDDQRYDFLSFKDHPWIKTPHIDKLAANGIYFDRAYVTTSLCSPSRASIVTGLYAHTHQVIDNDTSLPGQLPTFPKQLQEVGYHTGFVGKWHMGGQNDAPRPGFDYWASFKGQGQYHHPIMNINGGQTQFEGYTPDILTDLATTYIRQHANQDQPYCLFLSHKSIHEPFTPAPRHAGHFKDLSIPKAATPDRVVGKPQWLLDQRKSWHGSARDYTIQNYGSYDRFFQLYSECMMAVDESVGQITKTLTDLNQLEETVIIYFSDNGYLMGEHGLIDKRVMHEPSIRVPCFVHCPEVIKAPKMDSSFILNIDIGPTILDIAQAQIPASMHGQSFWPLVKGESPPWRNAFVYEYFIDPNAVQTPTIFGLRTQQYSYMTYHGVWDIFECYDMEKDPAQLHNLFGEVDYGQSYGPFQKHAKLQLPALAPTITQLEHQLDSLLQTTNGRRQPLWTK